MTMAQIIAIPGSLIVLYFCCYFTFGLRFFKKCVRCGSRKTTTHTCFEVVCKDVPQDGKHQVNMDLTFCKCGYVHSERYMVKAPKA